ncbi:MAG: metalloregulator ArsR/SmtB family transcription factor [Anaerolineae bacterium]|nr:metalloregulator ArsR/SmtB family transcription factor [Anaerolineae bacterium]
MGQEEFETLLNFFKALGNESRLKIIGMLANRECTVRELATLLDLKEPTVSQHLNMLKDVGLVAMHPEGNHHFYALNVNALNAMNKDVFNRGNLAALIPNVEDTDDAFERKVFKTFFDGERITQIPTGEKRLMVILKWLANKFEYGVRYTEKEVNAIITRHHPDYALLRRELVDCHFMQREKGIYWRVPKAATENAAQNG